MKLHNTIKLGSTSVLLNNMDKYVKRGQIWPFWPWKKTLRAIHMQTWLWQFISILLGQLYAKLEKKLLNSFGANGLLSAKRAKFDLSYLEKWPLERFNPIYLLICDLYHAKEASYQKEEKLLKRFWDRPLPSFNLDGRTDRQTDERRTTRH